LKRDLRGGGGGLCRYGYPAVVTIGSFIEAGLPLKVKVQAA